MLIALLAWAALLCAGLGSTVGGVSQKLASKLAASAQYLQRQGGPSLASRAARREHQAAAAELRVAEAPRAVVEVQADGATPVGEIAPPGTQPRTDARPRADSAPHLRSRHRSPLSRAPPLLA